MNPQIQNVFRKRKITYTIVFVVILGVYFFASAITQFHLQEGLAAFPKAFLWIGQNLIPDALAIRRFPKIMDKLIETALLSVAVTVIAAVFAFALSLFRVHRPQLHHETHRANHCCLFPECSRCGLGNASDVFLWAEHPDRIFRPVLYHIRNADPCVYRNH